MTTTTSRSRSADLERRWAAIRSKLEAHADDLATQGVLVSRVASGRKVWRVRFVIREGGRRVHKAVYVGDASPSCSSVPVGSWSCIGLQGRWGEEVAAFARFAASVSGLARRLPSGGSLRRESRGPVDGVNWPRAGATGPLPGPPTHGASFRGRRAAFFWGRSSRDGPRKETSGMDATRRPVTEVERAVQAHKRAIARLIRPL